ncbi:hypothetical protein DH2020_025593 [Rehmannia glutinosa]|uniref:F-box domain-containing protein n=1 Tax=Rehmannia glutinosa TaxID=99300 RepID=A0ABR0W3L3_REHGL
MKKHGGERNGDGFMDRISQLPQHILQHVLSFLSQKEAVQTSLLSKSWRYLWCTRPNIEFRESRFTGNKETFMSVLDKTLQGYHDQMLCIQEFCVEISNIDSVSESISLLEKWIPIVTMNMRLKTFNLSFSSNVTYFNLPVILVVFESEFLHKLYLKRCMLLSQKPLDMVLSKHLKTLSLKRVYIKDETFEKIMSSCPFIEYVVLHKCEGLRIIKVNKSHNLKHFDFDDYRCNYIIKIDVPTIETIKIGGFPNWCDHRKYFPHLKSLHLKFVKLSAELFNNFSSNFPCLEELSLWFCYGLDKFHLFSRSMKHLILALLGSIKAASMKAVIDAPNIVKFEYEGDIPGSISFTTSTKWKSNIVVQSNGSFDDYTSSRCLKLNELLKALSESEISVNIANPPLLVLDDDGGLYEPVAVENLSLSGYYWPFSSHARFLNCLFCVCHPRYVYAHPSFDEFLWKILVTEREMRHYFWQRDLEEVSMEAFDENVNERSPECGLPGKHKNIRFRLKWIELSDLP